MNKLISCLIMTQILLLSCNLEQKKGTVILRENKTSVTKQNIVLDREKYPTLLKDTLVLRIREQFSNDTLTVCVGNSCSKYFNITTNPSVSYSTTIPVSIKGQKHEEFRILFRGLEYRIRIRREFFFLDVSIGSQNILTATYSNEVLKLS